MTRKNRQSELLYNEELHKIYEITKNISPTTDPGSDGPVASQDNSLWLNGEDLKYYSAAGWSDLFSQKFQIVCDMMAPIKPSSPVKGQLWLDNGIMLYFDGMDWYPIKAASIGTEMSLLSFDKFLMLPSMTGIDTDPTMQYLLPSVKLDRFFINGQNIPNYTKLSDISLQVDKADVTDKDVTAIHMNPATLNGIDRKLILIDKDSEVSVINASEVNTEFYGFIDGTGTLLIRDKDYLVTSAGIELKSATQIAYNLIMAVKYRFGLSKHDGELTTAEEFILSGTNGINLDPVSDPICVFAQGMYLEQSESGVDNYSYNPESGFLSLSLEKEMSLSVISFPVKNDGSILNEATEYNGTKAGIVKLTREYSKPLVFISGEAMGLDSGLADIYTDASIPIDELHVVNAKAGMMFSVVEAVDMFVKDGIVGTTNTIPCAISEIFDGGRPLLFVDGIFISDSDVNWDQNGGSISIQGLTNGQSYVLLKDKPVPNNRLLFDDDASYFTIPTDVLDDALVYMNNELICSANSTDVNKFPDSPVNGQLVQLITPIGGDEWFKYSSSTSTWTVVSDLILLATLEVASSCYSTGRKSINILKDFSGKTCKYYAYSFADAIEQPLLTEEVLGKGTIPHQYKVAFNHPYTPMANELSVWVNGVRQYTAMDAIGDMEIDKSTFAIPSQCDPIFTGNPVTSILYVVERREGQENFSCVRDILTANDMIEGTPNTYQSHIQLYPGNIRVFIDGYRQPASSYKVLDSKTIMFNSFTNQLLDKDSNYQILDSILIEIREDYALKEISKEIDPGQNSWSAIQDISLIGLINTKDQVMIYINGAAYGTSYTIDRNAKTLILKNEDVWRGFSQGSIPKSEELKGTPNPVPRDIITFEWR